VRIAISDPELLQELCDYLGQHGLVAASATLDSANVLVPDTRTDLDAALILLAAVRAWRASKPNIEVTVEA
jgi:hypothetical protein